MEKVSKIQLDVVCTVSLLMCLAKTVLNLWVAPP